MGLKYPMKQTNTPLHDITGFSSFVRIASSAARR